MYRQYCLFIKVVFCFFLIEECDLWIEKQKIVTVLLFFAFIAVFHK